MCENGLWPKNGVDKIEPWCVVAKVAEGCCVEGLDLWEKKKINKKMKGEKKGIKVAPPCRSGQCREA